MSYIPKDVRLKDLIIPGTHDSNTTILNSKLLVPFSQCQKLNIFEQLSFGVRYLDLRYCMNTSKFLKKHKINQESFDLILKNVDVSMEIIKPYFEV